MRRAVAAVAAVAAIGMGMAGLACADPAADSTRYDLDIPAQDLPASLQALALATHHQLFFRATLAEGKAGQALHGKYTIAEAVQALLAGTGLTFEITASSVVLIRGDETGPVPGKTDVDARSGATARSEPRAGAGATVDAGSAQLADVTVTADRRRESLGDVPVSIAVITPEQLQQTGPLSTYDLVKFTPALQIESGYGNNSTVPRINLRGIGSDDFSPSATPSVGMYVDDVYLNSTLAQGMTLYDVEQMEIMRGPQGTLWGKNTTAGVIGITSKRPSADAEAYGTVTAESYDDRAVEGVVGGPVITDQLYARVSALVDARDGFSRNLVSGEPIGKSDSASGRFQLLWQPTAQFGVLLKYETSHSDFDVLYHDVGYLYGGYDASGYRYLGTSANVAVNPVPVSTTQVDSLTATATWILPRQWTLTSITARVKTNTQLFEDDDGSPIQVENSHGAGAPLQFSEELRLASSERERFTWLAGAYFLHESLPGAYVSYDPTFGPLGSTGVAFEQTTRNGAAFGSVSYRFTDALTGSAGARYTNEHKDLTLSGVDYTAEPDVWWSPAAAVMQRQYLNVIDSIDNGVVTWDTSLKYALGSSMVYGRIATGFRAGVFNTAPLTAAAYSKASPETLTSYELGIKGDYFDRRLRIALDGFYYDYRNLQVYELLGASGVLANGATASVRGIELEISAYLTPAWLVLASGAGIDPRYTHFDNDSVDPSLNPGGRVNLTGLPLEKAAKQTARIATDYTLHARALKVVLETDWRYSSFMKFREWADAPLQPTDPNIDLPLLRASVSQPGYSVGDVSVKVSSNNDRLTLRAFVKNVTNKVYLTNSFALEFNRSAEQMLGDPRVVGASVGVTF
jgi:iron complex outermembrane receptor protein